MTRVHTRPARMVYPDHQSIVGTGTGWLPLMSAGLCFVLTVMWAAG